MAKYIKKSGKIIISELNQREINEILKFNVPCRLSFINEENIQTSYIDMTERLLINDVNSVTVDTSDGESDTISFTRLFGLITKGYSFGTLVVELTVDDFNKKEGLFVLLGKLNVDLIDSLIYLDYDNKNEFYSIINRPGKMGESNKLYFFDLNNSILLFGENGPRLIPDGAKSITELIVKN